MAIASIPQGSFRTSSWASLWRARGTQGGRASLCMRDPSGVQYTGVPLLEVKWGNSCLGSSRRVPRIWVLTSVLARLGESSPIHGGRCWSSVLAGETAGGRNVNWKRSNVVVASGLTIVDEGLSGEGWHSGRVPCHQGHPLSQWYHCWFLLGRLCAEGSGRFESSGDSSSARRRGEALGWIPHLNGFTREDDRARHWLCGRIVIRKMGIGFKPHTWKTF